MATVNLGSIKFNWKGSYSGATAYVVDDVVESSGSSYICIAATTGNAPPNATYWEQMSSAGTNGTDGTDLGTTLTTQGDIVYRDGSGLARLGAGTSGQFLKTQGIGANPTWGDVATNHTGIALLEYIDGGANFRDLQTATGITTSERCLISFNTVQDPYNILGTTGSNLFQVNTTGAYFVECSITGHNVVHYNQPFLFNDTDSKYCEIPNSTFTGVDTNVGGAPFVGYVSNSDPSMGVGQFYYLETGHNYSVRWSKEQPGNGLGSSTNYLLANHAVGGVSKRNCCHRTSITKMGAV